MEAANARPASARPLRSTGPWSDSRHGLVGTWLMSTKDRHPLPAIPSNHLLGAMETYKLFEESGFVRFAAIS